MAQHYKIESWKNEKWYPKIMKRIKWILKYKSSLITTFHDFFMINQNANLTNEKGDFCGLDSKARDHLLNKFFQFEKNDNFNFLIKQIIEKSSANIFPSDTIPKPYKLGSLGTKSFRRMHNACIID